MTFDEQVRARAQHDPLFRARVEGARQVLTGSLSLNALPPDIIAAVVHAHDCAQSPPVDEIERLGAQLHSIYRAQQAGRLKGASDE
jgi:hypothetical protein